jgi:hypothetical protein
MDLASLIVYFSHGLSIQVPFLLRRTIIHHKKINAQISNCKLAHDMSQHCIPEENQLLFYVNYYDKVASTKITNTSDMNGNITK